MKIGTDGVLLGAVASVENNPNSILDIGSGTGVIALMLAQRSGAETIDAIEIDDEAHGQCVENFEGSPWSDRLFCYHASFQAFYGEMDETYDLIVSNPPFYTENVSSGNIKRDKARQNAALPFEQLFEGVHKLLAEKGVFSLIIPKDHENRVFELAERIGLFPFEILRVRGTIDASIKRSIIQFSRYNGKLTESVLTIERERHRFTKEYIQLTQDFYLKM
ncbi:MAG: tRNA1(Val) (adenine(37)-N6)-methyltransferase [Croceivirga sp.]